MAIRGLRPAVWASRETMAGVPHRGIDLASEEGEPVRSIAPGTVTFAGVDWERRANIPLEPWGAVIVHERHMGPRGLFVEIDHGNGVVSLYAHLGSYGVQVGDRIDAGQRLGEVGRTGIKDSGPHLHFGLFQDGKVLDPLEYLAAYVFPPTLTKRGHAELTKGNRRSRKRRQPLSFTLGAASRVRPLREDLLNRLARFGFGVSA